MLDLKRLRVLREVAQHGSFSAAGEALGYTQSAVSQQIAALEREAGSTLVERNARGVRLTGAGQALVEHADGILARVAAAEDELEAIAGLRGGRLRLASFPTAGATLVPLAIAEFSRRHPGVELSLVEAELALANLRDDVVIRSLGRQAPVRHVQAATLAGAYRSPATEAMLEVLQHAAAQYAERRPGRLAAA